MTTSITKEMLATKVEQCTSKFKEYEVKALFKLNHRDSPTEIAVIYRQMKSDLYNLQKDVEVANIILIDSNVIAQYIDKKVETLYLRAVEMLASLIIEINRK